jgi:CheY-like chemotaxis protein
MAAEERRIMSKKVLSVGQCVPDQSTLKRYIESHFDAKVEGADLLDDAINKLRGQRYDLVLVNRKLDADYSDGLNIIKKIKADPQLADLPVMLVTNYPEYHEEAVAVGGVKGFGKLEYDKPETKATLQTYLG